MEAVQKTACKFSNRHFPNRGDGRDLVQEWEAGHPRGKVVHTRDQLMDLDTESTDQVEHGASWAAWELDRLAHQASRETG